MKARTARERRTKNERANRFVHMSDAITQKAEIREFCFVTEIVLSEQLSP